MSWEEPPFGICNKCGNPITQESAHLINTMCGETIQPRGSRLCGGMFKTTRRGDWEQCYGCDGKGRAGNSRCAICQGTGWSYRKPFWKA
jgi:hypothetical protein